MFHFSFEVIKEDQKPPMETVQHYFPDEPQPSEHILQLPLASSLLPPSESLDPPPDASVLPPAASTLPSDTSLPSAEQHASVPEQVSDPL